MEDKEAKSILEAVLFIAGEPVSPDSLKNILEIDKSEVERIVKELIHDYTINNNGLLIVEVAGGVQMVTNPACSPWVKKMLSTAVPTKLSQPSLETLAIIAYKQPIIKAEIEAIRGVNSDGVVKTLLERKLVRILGRKEAPGRPLMYGTTKEFLQYFGLKDLAELPTLKEFQDLETPEATEHMPLGEEEYTGTAQSSVDGINETSGAEIQKGNAGTANHATASQRNYEDDKYEDDEGAGRFLEEREKGSLN